MKAKTRLAIKEVRVLRFDDKKILTLLIIAYHHDIYMPTIQGLISHFAYRRRVGPKEVQAKFKAITLPLIKEEIITIGPFK